MKTYTINNENRTITADLANCDEKTMTLINNYVALGYKFEFGEAKTSTRKSANRNKCFNLLNDEDKAIFELLEENESVNTARGFAQTIVKLGKQSDDNSAFSHYVDEYRKMSLEPRTDKTKEDLKTIVSKAKKCYNKWQMTGKTYEIVGDSKFVLVA